MPQDTCGGLFLEAMITVLRLQSIRLYGTLTTIMCQLLVTLWPSQDGKPLLLSNTKEQHHFVEQALTETGNHDLKNKSLNLILSYLILSYLI